MHSTDYKRAAQAADNIYRDIIAIAERPEDDDCHPSAWVVLRTDPKPSMPERTYSVHMLVLPDDTEARLIDGHYDLTITEAFEHFNRKTYNDCLEYA